MPTYTVKQFEVHSIEYKVEADNEAAAIAAVFAGLVNPVDNSQEFVELDIAHGMSVEQHPELAKLLQLYGVPWVDEHIIQSIGSVEEC